MRINTILSVIAVLLGIVYIADAATLTSPPVLVGLTETVRCFAQNRSDAPIQVSAQFIDLTGTPLYSGNQILSPNEVALLIGASIGDSGYCVFQFDAKKKNVGGYAIKLETSPNPEWELIAEAR